jgi:metal-dependent amidase/aminoacylase/carboxypeptidase family protein
LNLFDEKSLGIKNRLLHLAKSLQVAAEPAFEESKTIAIWRDFLFEQQIPVKWALHGHAPIVDWGLFGQAAISIVITADLDAVGVESGSTWFCEHSCGHFAQSVHALGLAYLLFTYGMNKDVAVRIIGCPGEECRPIYDLEYPLPYRTGKQRLLDEGWFSGANAVLSTHLADDLASQTVQFVGGANGVMGIRLCLSQFDPTDQRPPSLRTYAGILEKWQDEIRHITGNPQLQVRARSVRTGIELWTEFTQALTAIEVRAVDEIFEQLKAQASIDMQLISSYAPLVQSEWLRDIASKVLQQAHGLVHINIVDQLSGATDLGDVSQKYSVFQLFVGGTSGFTHDSKFEVIDDNFALLWPIQWLMNMIEELAIIS